ncbi:hypothetical protein Pint_06626 [Pistacia integerrima]|uniref:Uncharacterized protein n=1 Tax=Pistacia integerrima TaxID=434235 RepID=A0ACC0Z4Y9_9ROSI|nr:hypothetical protein Pint_06626 [Pistacia integerrima]
MPAEYMNNQLPQQAFASLLSSLQSFYKQETLEFLTVYESTLPLITIALLTLVAIVAGYLKLKCSWCLGIKLPPGSLGFPLVGESISFVRAQKQNKTDEWIQSRINKFGPVFKTSLLGKKTMVLTGQAGNRFVFSGGDNGISYNQPSSAVKIFGKYSLFDMSGQRHKLIRGAIASFLKPESIQRYLHQMDTLLQKQLPEELDGKDSVQVLTLMNKITFNVTSSIFFGLPDGESKDQLLEDFSITLKGVWAVPLIIPGTTLHRASQARGRVCKLLSKLILNRKTQMEEGTVDSQDNIISSLLVLRHKNEQREVVKAKQQRDRKLSWNEMQMMKYSCRVAQEIYSSRFDTSSSSRAFPTHIHPFWSRTKNMPRG